MISISRRRTLTRCACAFPCLAIALASHPPNAAAQTSPQAKTQAPAADLNARNTEGTTPLVAAAAAGNAELVQKLLARGASVDRTSADGRTPLIAAAQGGYLDIVEMLVKAGAPLNAATRFSGTALEVAERQDEKAIAAYLLAAGARSSGKSVGDTVCVLPWAGSGYCGQVKSYTVRSVEIQVTKLVGCEHGCPARGQEECSEAQTVGGADGIQPGRPIAVPSWCLTQTGVKP
jgi:hypothetical protein